MLGKYNINYEDIGKGKVVIFLHGWGGSIRSFSPIVPHIKCRCISIDFPGFGESPTCKNMDIYEYAESVYLFLKEKGIHQCDIVAHSFGCRVAIILASLYDIKIPKMIFTGGAGLKPRKSLVTKCKILRYKLAKRLVKWKLLSSIKLQKFGSSDYKNLNADMKRIFTTIVNQHLDYLVPSIKSSVLLVWGEKDKVTPMYVAKRFENLLKDSGLIVYPHCTHFAYLEKPADFISLVNYFINQ